MDALLTLDDDPTDRGLPVIPDDPGPVPTPRRTDPGRQGPPAAPDAVRRHADTIAGLLGRAPLAERYGAALRARCTRCVAPAGALCRDTRGNPLPHPHGVRANTSPLPTG